jgi:hypothetical protein
MRLPPAAVAVALSAVLSSGLTAAYLRSTMPETAALDGDPVVAPEVRHLAALLAPPGGGFRPTRSGVVAAPGQPATATTARQRPRLNSSHSSPSRMPSSA